MLGLALSLSISAQARLGWTLDECKEHYGEATARPSVMDGTTVYDFTVSGIHITASIGIDNVVSKIEYWKADYSNWNLDQIKTLLEKNKGNCTWDYDNSTYFAKDGRTVWDGKYLGEIKQIACWKKDDTKQFARWYLFVMTVSQLFIDRAHQQEKQAKNLDNL